MLLFLIACSAPVECYDACETVYAGCWDVVSARREYGDDVSPEDRESSCRSECRDVDDSAAVAWADDVGFWLERTATTGEDACLFLSADDYASPCPNGPRLEANDPDAWTCE